MSTKGNVLSGEDKQILLIDDSTTDLFRNLNLNQNHQCFHESPVWPSINKNHNKNETNYASSLVIDSHSNANKYVPFGQSKLNLSVKKLPYQMNQDSNDWDKGKADTKNANNSTLSLHITAYENAHGASKDDLTTAGNPSLDNGKKNKWKKPFDSSKAVLTTSFEFPRQQKDVKDTVPEVMQFKTSQKLKPTGVTTRMNLRSSTKTTKPPSDDPVVIPRKRSRKSGNGNGDDTKIVEEAVVKKAVVATEKNQRKEDHNVAQAPKGEKITENQQHCLRIQELEVHGFASTCLKKLAENGLYTVEAVAQSSLKRIIEIVGNADGKKLHDKANEIIPMRFVPASYLHARRSEIIYIHSGSRAIDDLLGGGIETGSLTEIIGEANTYKTQMCCTLAVTCQMKVENGGAEGKVIWIDTEGSFRGERIASIAAAYNLNAKECLANISYVRAQNVQHQMSLLSSARALMANARYALVIIDSIIHHYRTDFDEKEVVERQYHLENFLGMLTAISTEFNVAVVYTNQVAHSPTAPAATIAQSMIPCGGNILGHAASTRIFLKKGKENRRICQLYSSPHRPEGIVPFTVSNNGIIDIT